MTLELVVLSGLPASGKSSFYRDRLAETHACVSKDAWPNARRPERRQRRLLEAHLREGRSVAIDNTNPTPAERTPLIEIARSLGARVVSATLISSVADALRRNAARQGRARVPDVAIFSVAKRWIAPSLEEGFDRCLEVRIGDEDAGFVVWEVGGAGS